jgi:hypothetical protein
MRSFIAVILVLAAIWHVTSGGSIDLVEAVLAVGAAWFVSLFLAN